MVVLVISALLAAGPLDVEATTLDDRAVRGELVAITADALDLKSDEGRISIPLAKLHSVVPNHARATQIAKSTSWADLTDGSRLPVTSFAVKSAQASVTLADSEKLELPVSKLRCVRLLAHDEKDAVLDKLWDEISAAKLKGDAIVIRKGGDGKPLVLDYLEGAVGDVTDASIAFTVDGDVINVNRQKVKVEGIVFYRPVAQKTLPLCRVDLADGTAWSAKSLEFDGENLNLVTASGLEQSVPVASVKQLDLSLGKILFLSELEPLKADWQPYLSTANLSAGARELFGLRRDRNFAGKPLALGAASFRKGLALHSRSEIAWRLPGEFSRFTATVGIDPAQRSRGHVRLEVRGDDRVLIDQPIDGGDAPQHVDLDLAGVGRLTILVDYGEGLDIGDQLILGNARLIR
jgi:hypothetical protein